MTALHMERSLQGEPRDHRTHGRVRVREPGPRLQRQHLQLPAAARENARAVRGSLTSELWETLNSTWLDARSHGRAPLIAHGHRPFRRMGQGALPPHPRRHHRHHDARRGLSLHPHRHLSRARRQHRPHPHRASKRPACPAPMPSVVPDPYEWSVLLRALSAFEVYRRVYRDVITPYKVAQLLILRDDMPRSLLRCCKEVYHNLKSVANEQSAETERRAGEMHAMLHFTRMEEIIDGRIAALSASNFWPACAISAIASPRISWCPRRRLKRMQMHIRHETRYRYERPVKYSVQSLHLTPRRDLQPASAVLDHHGARPAARASRRLRQYLAPAHHRGAAPGNPDRRARRGRNRRHREPAGRRAALAARLSRPDHAHGARTRRSRPSRTSALRARQGAACPRPGTGRSGVRAVRYKPELQRRAGQRGAIALQERRRRLPGSRPRVHCRRPRGRNSGALRQRLSLHRRLQRRREPCLGGCRGSGRKSAGRAWTSPISRPAVRNYCRLAVGRDYLDAAPVRGVRHGGGGEQMEANVLVADVGPAATAVM